MDDEAPRIDEVIERATRQPMIACAAMRKRPGTSLRHPRPAAAAAASGPSITAAGSRGTLEDRRHHGG